MEYAINGIVMHKMNGLVQPISKTKKSLDSDIRLKNHYEQLAQLRVKLQSAEVMLCTLSKLDITVKSYTKHGKTMNEFIQYLRQIETHRTVIESFQNMFTLFDEEDDSDEENVILSVFDLILEKTKNVHADSLILIQQVKNEIQKLEQNPEEFEDAEIYNQRLALFEPRKIISMDSPQHPINKKIIHDLMTKIYKVVTRSRTATIVNMTNLRKEILQLSDGIEKTKKLHRLEALNQEEKQLKHLDLADGVADCSAQAYLLYYFIINSSELSLELKNNTYVFNFIGDENHTAVIIFEPYSKLRSSIEDTLYHGVNSCNLKGEDLSDAIIIDPWLKFVAFNNVSATDKTVGFVGPIGSYLTFMSKHKDGRYICKDKHDLAILSKNFTTILARSVINCWNTINYAN